MNKRQVLILIFVSALTIFFYTDSPGKPAPDQADASLALLQPADFQYLGAFKLPGGFVRPRTFAYGGNAMTFNPDGDRNGPADGFPGSLFITGHDRIAYGELPNGGQVAEIRIPRPTISTTLGKLKRATFLQPFREIAPDTFHEMEELPRMGMQYLNHPSTGPLIHLAWGQHFEPDPPVGTHAWISPNLNVPNLQGTWFIGHQSFYAVNGFMFEIPTTWANQNAKGRYLATGRFRDGGWSGMGPALFAYRPWIDSQGTPAAPGAHLPETVLLKYQNSATTDSIVRCLKNYQHPDEWEGGAWITTTSGKTAVLFAGTKAIGERYWYGFQNPAGPDQPCIEEELLGQFTLCRFANGAPCPPQDLQECSGHNDYRGWWSSAFTTQFILYNPVQLGQVARHRMPPWKPQPYTTVDVNQHMFQNPGHVEQEMLGKAVQRRYRIGDVAYDRQHNLLYVLELFAERTKPVVHVWRLL